MKKILITAIASATFAFAANSSTTTINATMALMNQGMDKIQKGFLLNQKSLILDGISVIKNADAIFNTVDTNSFIKHNNKTQVTKNISKNLSNNIEMLEQDVKEGKFSDATSDYGKALSNCVACHTIIRGW